MKRIIFTALLFATAFMGCSKSSDAPKKSGLESEIDTVAYILGMNIGESIRQIDSTLNVDALYRGVVDAINKETIFTPEQAKIAYLKYINYSKPEAKRNLEAKFLEEFAAKNRSYVQSKSGLTYTVDNVGDVQQTPSNDRDSVWIKYTIYDMNNTKLYETGDEAVGAKLIELIPGIKESVKLVGKGGQIKAWMPSRLAFLESGNSEYNVGPDATLFFEIELTDVKKYSAQSTRLR